MPDAHLGTVEENHCLKDELDCMAVKVGNDQEMAQSERNSHSKNRGGKNRINSQVRILRKHRKLSISIWAATQLPKLN